MREVTTNMNARAQHGQVTIETALLFSVVVAALVLARLWALTDGKEWRIQLDRQIEAFAGAGAQLALYGATLLRAADWAVNPVTRIEVTGPKGDGPACVMHFRALQTWRPRKVVVRTVAERPAAPVCVGTTCSAPLTEVGSLRGELERARARLERV